MTWVGNYVYETHGKKVALEIIEDIDHQWGLFVKVNKYKLSSNLLFSISAVPPYPGLCQFPDGQDYKQWTGDDSKALMKVSNCRLTV